jgi:hypothetical protein
LKVNHEGYIFVKYDDSTSWGDSISKLG